MDRYAVKNPVGPSPWTSRVPVGFNSVLQCKKRIWLNPLYCANPFKHVSHVKEQNCPPSLHRNRNAVQESSMLRNLNKSTLVLSFPDVHPYKIEAALSLCDNDLSECVNLLRNMQAKILNNRATVSRTFPAEVIPKPQEMIIPTKDPDVQIVEIVDANNTNVKNNSNHFTFMNVNNDMLHSYNTTVVPPSPLIHTTGLPSFNAAFTSRTSNAQLTTNNYNAEGSLQSVSSEFSGFAKMFKEYPEKQDYNTATVNLENSSTFYPVQSSLKINQ